VVAQYSLLGYGLDDRSYSPQGQLWYFSSSPPRPHQLRGPTQTEGSFPGSKQPGTWSWPLTSI